MARVQLTKIAAMAALAIGACGKSANERSAAGSAASGSAGATAGSAVSSAGATAGSAVSSAGATAGSGSATSVDAVLGDLTKRCTANESEACRTLGLLYSQGKGVTADSVRATALFKQACDLHNDAACNQWGLALAEGVGIGKDAAQAERVMQTSCDGGYAIACRNLGLMFRDGKLGAADGAANRTTNGRRAAELLAKACDAKVPYACTNLGDLLFNSPDDREQIKLGIDVYQSACNRGEASACRQIGLAYVDGRGLPKSNAAAAVWLQKACDGNDAQACLLMATLDPSKAATLNAKACKLGAQAACPATK